MKRRAVLSGAGTAVVSSLAGCAGDLLGTPATASFSDSYAVSTETTVTISNRNGPVTVQPSSGDELTISGEKQAASQKGLESISIDVVEDKRFVINVRFASGSDFSNRQVDLTVGIPDGVAVDVANTANGDVTVDDVRGDLNATTANGTVDVTNVSGYVRGETTNGNVRIRNCTGVRGARSSNGNVDVEIMAMQSDVTCSTSNGTVTVRAGPDLSAAIRLSTNTGSATVRNLEYTAETERKGYIVGSLRGGTSPTLFLGCDNGDVTLMPA